MPIDLALSRAGYAELGLKLATQWRNELDGVQRAATELSRRPRARNLKLMRELITQSLQTWDALSALCPLHAVAATDRCATAAEPLHTLALALAPPLRARELAQNAPDAIAAVKSSPKAAVTNAEALMAEFAIDSTSAQQIAAQDDFEYLGRLLSAMITRLHLDATATLPNAADITALRTLYFAQTASLRTYGLSDTLKAQQPARDRQLQRAIGALAPKVTQLASSQEINAARRDLARAIRDLGLALKVQVVVPGL